MEKNKDQVGKYKSKRNFRWRLFFILLLIIAVLYFFRGILASQDVAVRTLEDQGYSEIQIMEHAWFAVGWRGCDEKDAARFTARATNPIGKQVKVYVCTGVFFKGGTIRGM